MASKKKDQVQETPQAQELQGQSQEAQKQAQGASQETTQSQEVQQTQETQKKPVAYVYVGNQNRYEFEAEVDGKRRPFVLWRNMVYRNLPDCKAVRELIKKKELKPIYG